MNVGKSCFINSLLSQLLASVSSDSETNNFFHIIHGETKDIDIYKVPFEEIFNKDLNCYAFSKETLKLQHKIQFS